MKKFFVKLALCSGLLTPFIASAGTWQQVSADQAPQKLQLMHPKQFLVYTMDEAALKLQMWNLSADPNEGMIVTLPMPDGSARDFKVWESSMMPATLAGRYPEIKTFTAEAVDNRNVTAKLDFTTFGFHAMIFDGENTSFIDPYDAYHDGFYMVHYKKDEIKAAGERMRCQLKGHDEQSPAGESMMTEQTTLPKLVHKVVNGYQLRTYRLALSADHFYCQAAPAATTITAALSKMTTTMNRINGVYERELSIHMNFVDNEDTLIWTAGTGTINGTDPFNSIDGDAEECLDANQTVCDARIKTANYDIGHVFTTGAGGLSSLGCVCTPGYKAQSVTGSSSPTGDGFDIDFVAHEMGHEFGGEHPFNDGTNGSCAGGNRNAATAYEPGSGSTIMAYAGICDFDNIQKHSDAYFHAVNLAEMQAYVSTGGNCSVNTPTGNKLVGYTAFNTAYTIPYLTPFELTAPALTDSVADSATLYCWEEWDNGGPVGATFSATTSRGPLFRSYVPTPSATRVFPKISMVLAGILSNAGMENAQGEKVPTVDRYMAFRCTFRNILHNKGCFTFPDDSIRLHAVPTAALAGFKVTSQAAATSYTGGGTATVTWDVVGTNAAPVSAATVDIYMSVNGGLTYPYLAGTVTNNGSAAITLPNPAATSATCRFKVKGHGNVFFNVNSTNFTVTYNSGIPISPNGVQSANTLANDIKVFPVPARDVLHITSAADVNAIIINTVGQKVWQGSISSKADVSVAGWAKGIYYVRFTDSANGNQTVRAVVVE